MSRKRAKPRGKKINPHFWVFCEGETEAAYIGHLRSKYRLSIEIISKVSGYDISTGYINNYKQGKPVHEKDKDFLIYDSDIPEILDKLKQIKSAVLITSNPAIELWFLLHYKSQKADISEEDCIAELNKRNKSLYKKGYLDQKLRAKLNEQCNKACERAKKLKTFENPSSTMFYFIEELEQAQKRKMKL